MRKWVPLIAICLGAFMLLIDITIVNVALPSITGDLHASFAALQWVIDAYTLVLAALLLVTGTVADHTGHRRAYVIGLAVFGLASLTCALAPNPGALIAARAVQGIGGAAMFATAPALIVGSYQGRDRGTAFGIWGAVNGAAAAIGPLLGGLLTEHLGWQWIFLVNLPIAAVAIALSYAALPADRRDPAKAATRIDIPGALVFTVCAGALTYALINGGENGWSAAATVIAFVASGAALIGFVAVELTVAQPMLDLSLLRNAAFSGLMTGALLLQGAAFGALVLVSIWLQTVLGLSPVRGGLALMPLAAASFVTAALAGRFLHGVAPRIPIGIGMIAIAAGSVLLYFEITAGAHVADLVPGLILIGIGVGLATPVVVSAAVGTLPRHQAGAAGGVVNTFRQLGLTLGIAVFGVVFGGPAVSVLTASHQVPDPHGIASALTSGAAQHVLAAVPAAHRAQAAELFRHAFASGLDRVYLWCAVAAAVGGVLVLALARQRAVTHEPAPAPREPEATPVEV